MQGRVKGEGQGSAILSVSPWSVRVVVVGRNECRGRRGGPGTPGGRGGRKPCQFPPSLGLGAEHRRTLGQEDWRSSGWDLELFSSHRTEPNPAARYPVHKWVCGGLDVVVSVVA